MRPAGVTQADVLVVIPCLNEAQTLPGILDDLLLDKSATGLLVVVADGGSTDGTAHIAKSASSRDPRVKLLSNPKRLQSAGVNLAAQRFGADRDWLVRMDAHAAYPPNFVGRLPELALAVGADSVVVPMITEGGACFQRAVAAAQNSRLGTGGAAHRRLSGGGWVDHGHHALFALPRFRALGGYDEAFIANEDAEFDVRLGGSGGRIWLADELAIVYRPRTTPKALFNQYLRHGSGRAQTLLRHRLRPRLRQALPLAVAPAILLLPATLFHPLFAGPVALWAAASMAYGALLGARARSACVGAAGLAAMIMHLAWSCGAWGRMLGSPWARRKRQKGGEPAQ
jgi:succinoglycan biosynthesis protein ExoA